jgi:hypothetical protein
MWGFNEEQFAWFGLTIGVGAFMLYMLFIIGEIAWKSKAGKTGTIILFFVLSFGMLPTHMHIKRQRISGLFLALCLIHTQATRQRMIQSPLSMLLQGKPNLELEQYASAAGESMVAAVGKGLQHERDSTREKAENQQFNPKQAPCVNSARLPPLLRTNTL